MRPDEDRCPVMFGWDDAWNEDAERCPFCGSEPGDTCAADCEQTTPEE